MVVAGAEMRVGCSRVAVRVRLAAQQQRELRVRLQAEHAVDDLRARPAPAARAQLMLASSSKRASSSTTTVTSLPRRAASISASISTELAPVR